MKKILFTSLLLISSFGIKASPMYDFAILMDSSGSVGSLNWDLQVDFVETLITEVIPAQGTNYALINFGSNVNVAHSFADTQSQTAVLNSLYNINYAGGYTVTEDALITALQEFDMFSNPANFRRLIMITDGNPYHPLNPQQPCSIASNLFSEDIETFIFGVGSNLNWNYVDCLVNDFATQTAEITDFDALGGTATNFGNYLGITSASDYLNQGACVTAGHTWSDNSCLPTWPGYASSVPEPGMLMLLATGLLALRRRHITPG